MPRRCDRRRCAPGVVVQRAEGDHGDTALRVEPRHARAAGRAEGLAEVPRFRRPVGPERVFAANVAHVSHRAEAVGGMRRRAGLAAARAVTVVNDPDRSGDLVGDARAQTTSAQRAVGGWRRTGAIDAWIAAALECLVLGQRIGNPMPRGLPLHVDVMCRAHARIVVERTERDADPGSVHRVRHDGAAARAESTDEPGRGLVTGDGILALVEAEALDAPDCIGRERCAMRLAAHPAVTVRHPVERAVERPAHRAAQTASTDHRGISRIEGHCVRVQSRPSQARKLESSARPARWLFSG